MNNFLSIVLTSLLASNVIASLGLGTISLQSEKRNFLYMLLSSMFTIVFAIISGVLFHLVYDYVLAPLNLTFLSYFIMVLFTVILSFFSRFLMKLASKEMFYLYEKSYQFATQSIIIIAIMLLIDYNIVMFDAMFQLAAYGLGFLAVQLVFAGLYSRLDNTKVLKSARNIPLMLYVLGIVSMIVYTLSMFI